MREFVLKVRKKGSTQVLVLVLLPRGPKGLSGLHDAHLEEKEQIACYACSEPNNLYPCRVKSY